MSFEISVADKDRYEPLVADGKWHRLKIAGKMAQPIHPGGHDLTIHLFGDQAQRRSGTLWVRFTRMPSGDSTAWCPYPVDPFDPDFGAVLTTFLDVAPSVTGIAVDYRTKVPGLRLKNRVFKADPRG